jgi:hypothetical protein
LALPIHALADVRSGDRSAKCRMVQCETSRVAARSPPKETRMKPMDHPKSPRGERRWIVVRPEDKARMGSYADKRSALAAATRFGQDHCHYAVVEVSGSFPT